MGFSAGEANCRSGTDAGDSDGEAASIAAGRIVPCVVPDPGPASPEGNQDHSKIHTKRTDVAIVLGGAATAAPVAIGSGMRRDVARGLTMAGLRHWTAAAYAIVAPRTNRVWHRGGVPAAAPARCGALRVA
jgi:hypothetical protein